MDEGMETKASKLRTVAPQVIVATINHLLSLDLSMIMAFPTLVIGDLYKKDAAFSLNSKQASWVGSLVYIFQPIGSALSGIITEPLGRKRSMMLVNITPFIGWLLFHFAQSVTMLYVANAVMGFGIGLMVAPMHTYVGEISQPHMRGILLAYAGVMAQLGYLLMYLLGALMHWQVAAAASASVPVITTLCMAWMPESPLWLLSRGRTEEALTSLCWLRGWVPPECVKYELEELERYAETSKSMETTRQTFLQKLKPLFTSETLKPLLLVTSFFFFFHASGMSGVRPYMVHVIEEFQMPISTHWATVISAILGLGGNCLLTATVYSFGKRPLALISIAGCAIPCLILGTYAFIVMDFNIFPNAVHGQRPLTWLPLTMFVIFFFSTYFGIAQIPWMYVAEVFPLRYRSLGSGVSSALVYIMYFVATKSFLNLESSLRMHGVFWLYGVLSCVGFVYLYWILPETEGKTLEEVQAHFANKKTTSTSVNTLNSELGESRNSVNSGVVT